MVQAKQSEWTRQWKEFRDDELFLFEDWIHPNRLEDFRGRSVLECGCGGGQHTSFIAPFASEIVAVDLNTTEIARERNQEFEQIVFVEDDIATMDLDRQFDIVFSVGVVHHTDDPDKTIDNLKRHVKPGGRLIVWVYSREGNWPVQFVVEPLRRLVFKRLTDPTLHRLAWVLTALMYLPIYSIYLFPLRFLPYYQYFQNFRRMPFGRNVLNVYDKLNAPQVHFMSQESVERWFDSGTFADIHISKYKNVSWRASAKKREHSAEA